MRYRFTPTKVYQRLVMVKLDVLTTLLFINTYFLVQLQINFFFLEKIPEILTLKEREKLLVIGIYFNNEPLVYPHINMKYPFCLIIINLRFSIELIKFL